MRSKDKARELILNALGEAAAGAWSPHPQGDFKAAVCVSLCDQLIDDLFSKPVFKMGGYSIHQVYDEKDVRQDGHDLWLTEGMVEVLERVLMALPSEALKQWCPS